MKSPEVMFLASVMGGLIGLLFWKFKQMHTEAMNQLKEVVKANHKTALLVERHDEQIKNLQEGQKAAFSKLDKICVT